MTDTAKAKPRRRAPRGAAAAAITIVGIDTGGTFTDLAAIVDGELRVHKLPSTPDDPAAAVIAGLDRKSTRLNSSHH